MTTCFSSTVHVMGVRVKASIRRWVVVAISDVRVGVQLIFVFIVKVSRLQLPSSPIPLPFSFWYLPSAFFHQPPSVCPLLLSFFWASYWLPVVVPSGAKQLLKATNIIGVRARAVYKEWLVVFIVVVIVVVILEVASVFAAARHNYNYRDRLNYRCNSSFNSNFNHFQSFCYPNSYI